MSVVHERAIRQAVELLESTWGSGEVDAPYERAAVEALTILREALADSEGEPEAAAS